MFRTGEMKYSYLLCCIILFLFVISGCVRESINAREDAISQSVRMLPREPKETTSDDQRQFHEGDIVILHVVPGKEFEKELELTVNLQGEILVPLIGWVPIKGMTVRDAEEKIKNMLNTDYIVNPRVSLRVKEAKSRGVVLLGELKKPGTYEFPTNGKMALLEAVAKAEGFTDIANLEKVKVIRTLRNGKQQTIQVNVKKIFAGEEPDLELQEGDLVSVPETLF